MSTGAFWVIADVCLLYFFGWSGVLAHLPVYSTSVGLSEHAAANALAGIAILCVFGVLAFGVSVDRWNQQRVAAVGLIFFAAGTAMLLATEWLNGPLLILSLILIGLPSGGLDIVWASLLRAKFGTQHFGAIFSAWYLVVLIILVVGPIADVAHSFATAWLGIAVAMVSSSLLIGGVRLRNRSQVA